MPNDRMEIANGKEPDSLTYRVFLAPPNWVAEVRHPDGRILRETWRWAHEPVFRPDVADLARGEEVLDNLLNRLRS
jgi:hypothetical protein